MLQAKRPAYALRFIRLAPLERHALTIRFAFQSQVLLIPLIKLLMVLCFEKMPPIPVARFMP
jgi:hypothetical protein